MAISAESGNCRAAFRITNNAQSVSKSVLCCVRYIFEACSEGDSIHVVNKYSWADFTLPSGYVASHPPKGEVLVRQDFADGGYDGNYSWSEKCASMRVWTWLEKSRLSSYRAETLAELAKRSRQRSLAKKTMLKYNYTSQLQLA